MRIYLNNIYSCSRTAVVRVHGYKHEEELSLQDLEPSLGQNEIQHQIQQAELIKVMENRRILHFPRASVGRFFLRGLRG